MLTTRSDFLIRKGQAVCNDYYRYPQGAKWIVHYHKKFYLILDDGTSNGFYSSGEPKEIDGTEAKKILSDFKEAWDEAIENCFWSETLDEYFERTII